MSDTSSRPLTPAELADVREALDMPAVQFDDAMLTLNRLVPRLLATVEAYRGIVQAVAAPNAVVLQPDNAESGWCGCMLCNAYSDSEHTPACPVTKARALLGKGE